MNEQLNPYIAGTPITEAKMFFGRQDVYQWIEQNMMGQLIDHVLVVHGQRRVGKTSVLKQLSNQLSEHYIPIFLDLQGRSQITYERLLWWIARETTRVLKQDRGISIDPPNQDVFKKDPDYFENHFLPGLHQTLENHTLLFAFDEFDVIEDLDKGGMASQLYDLLKRLIGREGLTFIFSIGSSGRKLENMRADYTDLFKTALYKKISFLTKDDTYNLVVEPTKGVVYYNADAVEHIHQISSGHPYYTQLICHELFGQYQATGINTITKADVDAILDDVVERGTVNLKFIWDEASPVEKCVLTGIAHTKAKATSRNLAAYLRRHQVNLTSENIDSALLHLREREVLAEDNRFQIYLMKIWLQKNKPMGHVQQEINEIYRTIKYLLETGNQNVNLGLFDEAIDCFQEIMRIDPNHGEAKVGLSRAYVGLGDQSKAAGDEVKAVKYYDKANALNLPKSPLKKAVRIGRLSIVFSISALFLLSIITYGSIKLYNSPLLEQTLVAFVHTSTQTKTPTITSTPTFTPQPTPTLSDTSTSTPNHTPTITPSPTQTSMPTLIRDGRGIEMMLVSAGDFTMGGWVADAMVDCVNVCTECDCCSCYNSFFVNHEPVHTVYLDAFYIDKYEVTNEHYQACVVAGVCTPPVNRYSKTGYLYFGDSHYNNFPVINVDWFQAQTYCEEWREGRLPTEAEWEKAARGTDNRLYPWGEGINSTLANYGDHVGWTAPVGSYPMGISPYGIYDMAGNAMEWVADWYNHEFYVNPPPRNPISTVPEDPQYEEDRRVVRGGSWHSSFYYLHSNYRYRLDPYVGYSTVGFRCATSP